jgi:Tubulin-tyrosine ligase family
VLSLGSVVKTVHPFTIALVAANDGDRLLADPAVPLGTALSRWGAADVLVCPWHAVRLTDGTVQITGPMVRCVEGTYAPFTADHMQPDALLSFPTADHTAPDRSPQGRAALGRLAAQGLVLSPCELTTTAVVASLLHEAAHRHVVSNALDHDAAWGRKDQLEFILRAHARFTGEPVPRPETYVASLHQLPVILADFARRDLTCIVKPANGARGDGLRIVRPADQDGPLAVEDDCLVVQELVQAPLTLRGHKIDFRCYVMIDTADPHASQWCPPLFARIAGLPYERGLADAEITNCAYRARAGLAAGMFPLEHLHGLPAATRAALLDAVDALIDAVIAARFLRARAVAPSGEPRRVLLWGLDLIATEVNGEIAVHLLEVNVYPHLLIGSDTCDPAVADILGRAYVDVLRHGRTEGAT